MPGPERANDDGTRREDFAMHFAKRMQMLRETRFGRKRGSKSSAAAAIGVTPSDWRGYENGVLPGADKICRICEAMGCDANWLLGLPEKAGNAPTEAQEKMIRSLVDVQEALHAFDGMFTDCLLHLRQILAEPEIAQAQCFKLYAIAQRFNQLRNELENDPDSS